MEPREIATLGGGCFWCLDAVYRRLRGMISVEAGYTGGSLPHPSYEQVCTGRTGHIEVVRLAFDPGALTYRAVLEVFFAIHDPTTRDRQGNDAGEQYRSVIFHHSEPQRETAEQIIRELQPGFRDPIVTEVRPAGPFYPAEDYHQNYFERNPNAGYCAWVVAPKVRKFREKFAAMLK
ncbi:MAG: peptide-methionine (S)-S-oxide reductase MsrA [Bryobacteraceae bacterium]